MLLLAWAYTATAADDLLSHVGLTFGTGAGSAYGIAGHNLTLELSHLAVGVGLTTPPALIWAVAADGGGLPSIPLPLGAAADVQLNVVTYGHASMVWLRGTRMQGSCAGEWEEVCDRDVVEAGTDYCPEGWVNVDRNRWWCVSAGAGLGFERPMGDEAAARVHRFMPSIALTRRWKYH